MDDQRFQPPPQQYAPPPPQYHPQSQHFRPMTVGEILDRTFRLYRKHFIRFIAIIAVVYVPITLISLLAITAVTGAFGDAALSPGAQTGMREVEPGEVAAFIVPFFVGLLLFVLAQALCNAALVKSVSESYLGNEVTVGQAYKAVLPRLLSIIAAGILVAIVIIVGLVCLIVPGIIFALWFALTMQAIVVEKRSATSAMGRSKALVAGNLGKVFGLWFLVAVINWIVGRVFQFIGAAAAGTSATGDVNTSLVIQQLFVMVGQALIMPISAGAFILLYYDLRIRKEGFDLEMLARSLGSGGTPPHGAPPLQQV